MKPITIVESLVLQHPHIFNLRYLYLHSIDDQTSELWMIFPPIFSTVNGYIRENLSLSVKQLLSWMVSIADALQTLHKHELIHRNVILRNILLTEDGKVVLSDQMDGGDINKRQDPIATPDGIRDDMKGFGTIGTLLSSFIATKERHAPILSDFTDLMASCTQINRDHSITAEFAHHKLQSMLSTV